MLEAEVIERLEEPEPAPRRPRRGWIVPLVVLAIGGAIVVLPRQEQPRPERPGVANPPPPTLRLIGLPRGLSDRTVDRPVRIAFSAGQDVPEGRAQVSQLWRLDLPTGELTPGPIVGQVVAMRYGPDRSGRLTYLEADGSLYLLEGFIATRPSWVDAGVSAFDVASDGSLVYAKVARRSLRSGGAAAVVRLGLVPPEGTTPTSVRTRTIRNLNLRGFTVRRSRLIAWGVRGGKERVIVWNARTGALVRGSRLDPSPRARSAAGFWELDHPAASRRLRGIPGDPAHLETVDDLVLWPSGRGINVVDRRGWTTYFVELPSRFPTPTGPIAAARR